MREVTSMQDLEAVVAAASSEHLPTVVKFGAKWCAPCRAMEPALQRVADQGLAVVIAVDIDDAPRIAQAFQVQSIPMLVLYRNGRQIAKRAGRVGFPELAAFVASG